MFMTFTIKYVWKLFMGPTWNPSFILSFISNFFGSDSRREFPLDARAKLSFGQPLTVSGRSQIIGQDLEGISHISKGKEGGGVRVLHCGTSQKSSGMERVEGGGSGVSTICESFWREGEGEDDKGRNLRRVRTARDRTKNYKTDRCRVH